ncbi:MAG TPA: glycosyltransferase family 2 protein [Candidatus Goldiibacteriota bacterium]|nr:glycosyltransferase family 2 protein [Candidatus Goldiibacteriota bacterium]
MELTILMPCLNEAETLAICIRKARAFLSSSGISGEVLVADNGSTDGSVDIAKNEGSRLIQAAEKGYGSALIAGIKAAKGKYVIMGDADDSYDFSSLMPFMEKLRSGYDLVMGNRFKGGIEKGAMPPLHRYLGNPVLSGIGRLFFRTKIGDFHCGLRGFNREAMLAVGLNTLGMEFASEMVVRSVLNGLKITEVPVKLKKDGRSRPPHLRSWSDGWRHLKFLLTFSPDWIFLYPGIFLIIAGLAGTIALSLTSIKINNVSLDVHTMLYSVIMVILGVQIVSFSLISRAFADRMKLFPAKTKLMSFLSSFSMEKGLISGSLLFIAGFALSSAGVIIWANRSFGDLVPSNMLRLLLPAALSLCIGLQVIFTSLLLAVLSIRTGENA